MHKWLTTLLFSQEFKLSIYTQENCSPKLSLSICSQSPLVTALFKIHLSFLVYMEHETTSETAPASSFSGFSFASFLQCKFYNRKLFLLFYLHSPSTRFSTKYWWLYKILITYKIFFESMLSSNSLSLVRPSVSAFDNRKTSSPQFPQSFSHPPRTIWPYYFPFS